MMIPSTRFCLEIPVALAVFGSLMGVLHGYWLPDAFVVVGGTVVLVGLRRRCAWARSIAFGMLVSMGLEQLLVWSFVRFPGVCSPWELMVGLFPGVSWLFLGLFLWHRASRPLQTIQFPLVIGTIAIATVLEFLAKL